MSSYIQDDPELRAYAEKLNRSFAEKLSCIKAVLDNEAYDNAHRLVEIADIMDPTKAYSKEELFVFLE